MKGRVKKRMYMIGSACQEEKGNKRKSEEEKGRKRNSQYEKSKQRI